MQQDHQESLAIINQVIEYDMRLTLIKTKSFIDLLKIHLGNKIDEDSEFIFQVLERSTDSLDASRIELRKSLIEQKILNS